MVETKRLVVIPFLAVLASCASIRDAEKNMIKYQADDFLIKENNTAVDLIALISGGQTTTSELIRKGNFDQDLHRLVVAFSATASTAAQRRNLVQDRLRQSADQKCKDYKTVMLSKQVRANFWLGTTSLLFGAAGAATSTVDVARAFSGASALFTGVRSEYNQSFYLDKTVNVLAKAISRRQAELWKVVEVRRAKPISAYSLYEAVRDVSEYHEACSLVGALELTDKAVESFDVLAGVNAAVANEKKINALRVSLGLSAEGSTTESTANSGAEESTASPGPDTAASAPPNAASAPSGAPSSPLPGASGPQ